MPALNRLVGLAEAGLDSFRAVNGLPALTDYVVAEEEDEDEFGGFGEE
jgi:hypothetical protein